MHIHNILKPFIGSQEDIRRSITSGIWASSGATLLFVVCFFIVEVEVRSQILPFITELNFAIGYLLILFSLAFVFISGRSIGWLLIRPLAQIFTNRFGHLEYDEAQIWGISSSLVIIPILLVAFAGMWRPGGGNQAIVLPILVLGGILIGWLCAVKVAGIQLDQVNLRMKELPAIGATITGSLVAIGLTFLNIWPLGADNSMTLAELVPTFVTTLLVLNFLASIPFQIINLLATGLLKIDKVKDRPYFVYGVTSAIIWALLGFFLINWQFGNGLPWSLTVGLSALAGACGGWGIAQFWDRPTDLIEDKPLAN